MRIKPLTKHKTGSALLLTLLVVSLLLVLVLGFVVFVRLQAREITNRQNLRIARQNALLGMELAVSQLQKYAGADQRVTVPATTVFPLKDFNELYDGDADVGSSEMISLYRNRAATSSARSYLSRVGTYTTPAERRLWDADLAAWWNTSGRNPHWTGVFNSARRVDRATNPGSPVEIASQYYEMNPDTLHGEPRRDQLPVWLISGNEGLEFNPLTDSAYPVNYLTPDQELPDPEDPGSNTVWLVGEGSATQAADSVDGLDGRVKAPRRGVGTGHYAYWVGDESLKANFAVREPDVYANAAEGTVEYRNRLQVPQRVGWERMKGFDAVFDANSGMDVNDPNFAKVISQSQIGLVNPGFNEPMKRNFHHVTSTSQSLLTDTALGGLKKDLTRYLEDGAGPDDDDPIADPARYNVNDSRFAAWGGTNTGFPNNSAAALDGIPTFGQLRSWYQNEATGAGAGSIDPDPDSGAVPVLAYVHFQNGMSYEGNSKMIRMHWAPIIVLWNPLDVGLKNATYDLEMGMLFSMDNFLLINENPTLAERQALDPEADWQLWTISASVPNGPGGKPLLKAESNPSNGQVTVSNVTTPGTYEIFKMDFNRGNMNETQPEAPPGGDTTNRYMVKLTGDPDAFNTNMGPWVFDSNTAGNATSDAFGRIYYATRPGQTQHMLHVRKREGSTDSNSSGMLANKHAFTRVSPHDRQVTSIHTSLPVDRPFPFRLITDFGPGEVKVFTLGSATEWTQTGRLNLVNDYDPDLPGFFWMNLMEVVDGPASSESERLRWIAYLTTSSPPLVQLSPTVKMSVQGTTFFETERFGAGGGWDMGEGNDFNGFHPFDYYSGPSANPNAGNGDKDGDGIWNSDEPMPKLVDKWRPLFDFENFEDNLQTQTGSLTDRANWAFGDYFLNPFQITSSLGAGSLDAVNHFHAVFSRYNLGARDFEGHPLTDKPRNRFGVNNIHPDVSGNEGLEQQVYQKGRGTGIEATRWDNKQVDQSSSTARGFTLASDRDDGTDIIRGLTRVAIRNAKRADSEILSLGQLQQVNLSRYFWQPSFPIGNSDSSAHTDREAIAGIHSRVMGADKGSANFMAPGVRPNHARSTNGSLPFPASLVNSSRIAQAKDGEVEFWGGWQMGTLIHRLPLAGNTMLDLSYLLNENLWDRFYLSTLTSAPGNLADPLPNARLRFNSNAASAPALLDYDLTSAYLTALGSLNVNSTSVEAWKALLTSFRDLKLGEGGGQNPDNTVPVTRTLTPIGERVTFDFDSIVDSEIGAVSTRKDYSDVLSGFRYLTDDMIQALAERIVDEVRLRGPFYSLADFVNRRLAPPQGSGQKGTEWYDARTRGSGVIAATYDPFPGLHGLNGALQRAINLSGINGGVNHPDLGDDGAGTGNTFDMVYSVRIRNTSSYTNTGIGRTANSSLGATGSGAGYKHTIEPAVRSHLDTENLAAAPVGEAGQLLQGAPGFITQGDLLAMIGPALTARGDTFLIRSYGDVAVSGTANARAWLEAVVQRVPEPLRPAGTSGEDAWRPADSFGRRFQVVSVRWLTPEEL